MRVLSRVDSPGDRAQSWGTHRSPYRGTCSVRTSIAVDPAGAAFDADLDGLAAAWRRAARGCLSAPCRNEFHTSKGITHVPLGAARVLSFAILLASALLLNASASDATRKPDPALAKQVLQDVRDAYTPRAAADRYLVPTGANMDAMRALAASLTRAMREREPKKAVDALREKAEALRFELLNRRSDKVSYWMLREAKERRGRGIYLFLEQPGARKTIYQVPHARFDISTDRIGASLFSTGQAVALFANTMSRNTRPPKEGEKIAISDVANYPKSFFQAATEGVAASIDGSRFVQIHGYGSRKDAKLAAFKVILSGGRKRWSGALDPMVSGLTRILGEGRVARYGVDVKVMGATRNAQGIHIRTQTDDRFIHLELSRGLREQLRKDAELRRSLNAVLVTSKLR